MTHTIDFARLNFAALRESVELESRADLLAACCHFGEASDLMKRANKTRREAFGPWTVNELRDFTMMALDNAKAMEARRAETPKSGSVHDSAVPKGFAQ